MQHRILIRFYKKYLPDRSYSHRHSWITIQTFKLCKRKILSFFMQDSPLEVRRAFGLIFGKFRYILQSIRGRMKNSVKWSGPIKAINGLCWAAPFAAIGAFPPLYQYLILLGIGLGNTSTYIFMKKYSGLANHEQIIVGAISLVAIPVAVFVDTSFVSNQTIAVIVSRLMIAAAYGVGGIYALVAKK